MDGCMEREGERENGVRHGGEFLHHALSGYSNNAAIMHKSAELLSL